MYKTGDIIVKNAGVFGHVLMCYVEEDDNGIGNVDFIHGTNSGNFDYCSKLAIEEEKENFWHFRPIDISDTDKTNIKTIADKIKRSSKYGCYRAFRLGFGDSEFGKGAKARLAKYKERNSSDGDKFVSTITCVEAVVLCYQLAFQENAKQFIQKDAAHTMPRTLASYLKGTPSGWQVVVAPK